MSLKSEYIGDLEEPAVSSEPRGEFSLFGKVPVAGFLEALFLLCAGSCTYVHAITQV